MRQERTVQATIFEVFAAHQIGCELKTISHWLDGQRALVSLVAGDLRREGVRQTGRRGLPAETVLRCALLNSAAAAQLRGTGFSSGRFGVLSRLCPLAVDLVAEKVGPASHHQCDPRRNLGGGR